MHWRRLVVCTYGTTAGIVEYKCCSLNLGTTSFGPTCMEKLQRREAVMTPQASTVDHDRQRVFCMNYVIEVVSEHRGPNDICSSCSPHLPLDQSSSSSSAINRKSNPY